MKKISGDNTSDKIPNATEWDANVPIINTNVPIPEPIIARTNNNLIILVVTNSENDKSKRLPINPLFSPISFPFHYTFPGSVI
jgi:hypothetical protein